MGKTAAPAAVKKFRAPVGRETGPAVGRETGPAVGRETGSAVVRETGSAVVRETGSAVVRETGSAVVRETGSAGNPGSHNAGGGKDTSPFPHVARPLISECVHATNALISLHGKPVRSKDPLEDVHNLTEGHHQVQVLDSLVRTILSQNTTDKTSIRAFRKLKSEFPTWEHVLHAPNSHIEAAIKEGGLAEIKTERIKSLLKHLDETRGSCCLEWLREESTEFVKEYLGQFKGIGPKTISCTLLFAMDREDFPVDTHVWRISRAMGWVPKNASREAAYGHLNARVPEAVKYDLHVLLVRHGKVCGYCSSRPNSRVTNCPLKEMKDLWKAGFFEPQYVSNPEGEYDLVVPDHDIGIKKEEENKILDGTSEKSSSRKRAL